MTKEEQTNAWKLRCYFREFDPKDAAFDLIIQDQKVGDVPEYRKISAELRARHVGLKIIGKSRVLVAEKTT